MIPLPLVVVGIAGSVVRALQNVRGYTASMALKTSQPSRLVQLSNIVLSRFSMLFRDVIAPIVVVVLAVNAALAIHSWLQRRRQEDQLLVQLKQVEMMIFRYDAQSRTVVVGLARKNPNMIRLFNFPTDQIIYSKTIFSRRFSWNFFCVSTVHVIRKMLKVGLNLNLEYVGLSRIRVQADVENNAHD